MCWFYIVEGYNKNIKMIRYNMEEGWVLVDSKFFLRLKFSKKVYMLVVVINVN